MLQAAQFDAHIQPGPDNISEKTNQDISKNQRAFSSAQPSCTQHGAGAVLCIHVRPPYAGWQVAKVAKQCLNNLKNLIQNNAVDSFRLVTVTVPRLRCIRHLWRQKRARAQVRHKELV